MLEGHKCQTRGSTHSVLDKQPYENVARTRSSPAPRGSPFQSASVPQQAEDNAVLMSDEGAGNGKNLRHSDFYDVGKRNLRLPKTL